MAAVPLPAGTTWTGSVDGRTWTANGSGITVTIAANPSLLRDDRGGTLTVKQREGAVS